MTSNLKLTFILDSYIYVLADTQRSRK